MSRLREGQTVRHFKDPSHKYRILYFGENTETNEEMVVYQALYNDFDFDVRIGKIYIRPYSMFMSEVDKEKYPDVKQKYRFEEVNYYEEG